MGFSTVDMIFSLLTYTKNVWENSDSDVPQKVPKSETLTRTHSLNIQHVIMETTREIILIYKKKKKLKY